MHYQADQSRYATMRYNRVGASGLKLPAISLGLWHNFGGDADPATIRAMLFRAFDLGVTHFDLANNYGPPAGSAESNFGEVITSDLAPYRDELVISSKAGYGMWDGPYGEWGSRKYLVASCDQSLERTGLDYFDIFYSHRYDPETPLEETASALDYIVCSGRALYAGISNYPPEETRKMIAIMKDLGTPCLIHQFSYSMFNRGAEDGLIAALESENVGAIVFSPLAQGLLTERYLNGIDPGSRAGKGGFLNPEQVTDDKMTKVRALAEIAKERGQSIAALALAWTMRNPIVASALVGASSVKQIEENAKTIENLSFTADELAKIDAITNA